MLCIFSVSGLLSNQGEKSINFYFIRVPLRKKVLKYGTPKPRRLLGPRGIDRPVGLAIGCATARTFEF